MHLHARPQGALLRARTSQSASITASPSSPDRLIAHQRPDPVAANASLATFDRPLSRRHHRPLSSTSSTSSSRIRPAAAPLPSSRRRPRPPAPPPRVNPFDLAWGTSLPSDIDPQQLAANLFAFSIFPYAGFLFHLHRSRATPKLTLFGFYFLLVFVFGTIPAGIYAKVHYGKILADVDWLHGGAESLLTLTNLFVVVGLRQALREAEKNGKEEGESSSASSAAVKASSSSAAAGDK